MESQQLIAACKKQDINAQRELYETYAPRMMGLCLKYCKDYDAAQDLLHDGFIKVFTQIKKYSGSGSFEGWMPTGYRTVFNLYVFEEMTHKEIAEKLGIIENASRSQFSRAKSYLKNKVNGYLANNNG